MEIKQQQTLAYKILHFPVTRILLGGMACIGSVLLIKQFITKPFFLSVMPTEVLAASAVNFISFCLFLVSYYLVFKYYEKRVVSELSTVNLGKELGIGLVLGASVMSLEFGTLFVLGNYEILGFAGFDIFLKPFFILLVMALLEEIFFRGMIHRIAEESLGTNYALLISAVIFQIAHFGNDHEAFMPALLGTLFGLVMGIMYTYTKRLWLPFAFHFIWNFMQLVFGSNLSGIDEFGVMFRGKLEGPVWLIGSEFGIEDSILTLIVLAVLFIYYYRKALLKGHIIKPYWKRKSS